MVEVARRLPKTLEELRRVPGVGELAVRRLGDRILSVTCLPLATP
ncbi:MAG: HRDC domain-containing protein [Deltaproteobacteria bacterium]